MDSSTKGQVGGSDMPGATTSSAIGGIIRASRASISSMEAQPGTPWVEANNQDCEGARGFINRESLECYVRMRTQNYVESNGYIDNYEREQNPVSLESHERAYGHVMSHDNTENDERLESPVYPERHERATSSNRSNNDERYRREHNMRHFEDRGHTNNHGRELNLSHSESHDHTSSYRRQGNYVCAAGRERARPFNNPDNYESHQLGRTTKSHAAGHHPTDNHEHQGSFMHTTGCERASPFYNPNNYKSHEHEGIKGYECIENHACAENVPHEQTSSRKSPASYGQAGSHDRNEIHDRDEAESHDGNESQNRAKHTTSPKSHEGAKTSKGYGQAEGNVHPKTFPHSESHGHRRGLDPTGHDQVSKVGSLPSSNTTSNTTTLPTTTRLSTSGSAPHTASGRHPIDFDSLRMHPPALLAGPPQFPVLSPAPTPSPTATQGPTPESAPATTTPPSDLDNVGTPMGSVPPNAPGQAHKPVDIVHKLEQMLAANAALQAQREQAHAARQGRGGTLTASATSSRLAASLRERFRLFRPAPTATTTTITTTTASSAPRPPIQPFMIRHLTGALDPLPPSRPPVSDDQIRRNESGNVQKREKALRVLGDTPQFPQEGGGSGGGGRGGEVPAPATTAAACNGGRAHAVTLPRPPWPPRSSPV
ncbi:hypothetical protein C8A05DRAFT_38590, partial [Staphylotrichum tortipilum]